jgi:hypothetical protein
MSPGKKGEDTCQTTCCRETSSFIYKKKKRVIGRLGRESPHVPFGPMGAQREESRNNKAKCVCPSPHTIRLQFLT